MSTIQQVDVGYLRCCLKASRRSIISTGWYSHLFERSRLSNVEVCEFQSVGIEHPIANEIRSMRSGNEKPLVFGPIDR